ncbi:hypothetical protein [Acetobacter indonesiensis]|uniref:Uncharacterized protein n=1 Tax=Acetobacter indonesiensis TaxID=104101 RepID=A0A252AXN3_9PROT|nr:hypothetical protein [Acetobacter indonesiensis]OUI96312.1 hypothetical protein HK17_11845 [Acetobacter indonesiensis]
MPVPAIKTAVKEALKRIGGIDAAASIVRVGRSQLSDYGNRNSPQIVPVDVAVVLDNCAQSPLILAAMAHAEGFGLVPLHFGEGHIPKDMAKFAGEASLTIQRGFEALEDQRIDVHEAQELIRCLGNVILVSQHMQGTLGKIVSANKPHIVSENPEAGAA